MPGQMFPCQPTGGTNALSCKVRPPKTDEDQGGPRKQARWDQPACRSPAHTDVGCRLDQRGGSDARESVTERASLFVFGVGADHVLHLAL